MKISSLEDFYFKINKQIKVLSSYTEIKKLDFVVRSCRLKPYDFILNKTNNVLLYKVWVDEFKNSLNIMPDKKIKIIYNDLSLDHSKITCTDIYYNLTIDNIYKFSKLIYCYYGNFDNDNICLISFLGLDNYLRTYMYQNDTWQQVSSLSIGIDDLFLIHDNLEINSFINSSKKENKFLPCTEGKSWLSSVPVSDELLPLIKRDNDYLFNLIKGFC